MSTTRLPPAEEFKQHVAAENAVEESAAKVAEAIISAVSQAADFESIEIDDAIPLAQQYFSIGYSCQLLQISPAGLRDLMRRNGVKFAKSENHIGFIDGIGLARCHHWITELRKKVDEAK